MRLNAIAYQTALQRRQPLAVTRPAGASPARLHSICATFGSMKTAQLPPVRVEPAVRDEIESVLQEGESLSQFVEAAAVQAARRRKAQQAFLARGRASLAHAKRTGEFYPLHDVLDEMRARLEARMDKQRRAKPLKTRKS